MSRIFTCYMILVFCPIFPDYGRYISTVLLSAQKRYFCNFYAKKCVNIIYIVITNLVQFVKFNLFKIGINISNYFMGRKKTKAKRWLCYKIEYHKKIK